MCEGVKGMEPSLRDGPVSLKRSPGIRLSLQSLHESLIMIVFMQEGICSCYKPLAP
jgi:hypothetical protein